MKQPCRNCPFRTDKIFPLNKTRRTEIADGLWQDSDFPCHKTTGAEDTHIKPKRCTGAAIFLQHSRPGGLLSNLSFRLAVFTGEIIIDKLDTSSPVAQTYNQIC